MLLGAIFGWKRAPFLVTPIAAALTLVVTYRLARRLGLDRRWSAAAAALLAIAPTFLFMAVQPMSDVTATLWCTAAIFFALRALDRPRYAALCGIAFSIAVWVRPSNLLLGVAVAIAVLFGTSGEAPEEGRPFSRRRLVALATAIGASVPFAVALLLVNRVLYGSAFATGYGPVHEMLSFSFAAARLPHYAKWLFVLETPIVFPGALFIAIDRRAAVWKRVLLLVWFAAFFGFYIFYWAYDAWWYTRFLLPAFPALLIATLLVLRDIPSRWTWRWTWLLVAVIAVQSVRTDRHFDIIRVRDGEAIYPYAARWAEKKLPPDALPVAMQLSGSLYFYDGRFSVRYDNLDPGRFQELRAYAGAAGLHWYAVVFNWEVPELQKNMPGTWTKLETNRNVLLLRLDS
jgi:4-amino-4-deoxy-L-arabinose transferase-like glycosyltransferase